jgi:hypothetical protein
LLYPINEMAGSFRSPNNSKIFGISWVFDVVV